MPRKLRRPKDRRPEGADRLSPRVAHYLLFGPGQLPPAVEGEDPFEIFGLSRGLLTRAATADRGPLEGLWCAHRDALLAEWRRRGGVGPCWAEWRFEGKPSDEYNPPYDDEALTAAYGPSLVRLGDDGELIDETGRADDDEPTTIN